MRANKIIRLVSTIAIVALLCGCASSTRLNNANLAHLYHQEGVVLKPMFTIHHIDDEHSRVFFQASSDQLLYIKDTDENNTYYAKLKVQYFLYDSFENSTILDSGNVFINDKRIGTNIKILEEQFDFKSKATPTHNSFVLRVILTDLNRKLSYENLFNIYRTDKQNRQNFLLKSHTGRVRFLNVVGLNEPFLLENNQNTKRYKVRYYNRNFPIALPPYASNSSVQFKYAADSIFTVNAKDTLKCQSHGFYHFQIDESSKEGFTVFCYKDEFPLVTKKKQLGEPLRYLTNSSEFRELKSVDDKDSLKYIVDKFWLRSAGSISRGKMLVSKYYNRVEEANLYFSSYLEGWKTDRGIIYVILGPPSRVVRNSTSEIWIYGNENSSLEMNFNFAKIYNPFTDNDYALSRLNKFRYPWGQAIDAWRHGTAYGVKEIIRAQDERDQQIRASTPPNFWY